MYIEKGTLFPNAFIATDIFTDLTESCMKLNRLITLLAISLAWLFSKAAYPQIVSLINTFPENYSVSFITMQEGLSHNFVEDIFRDSKGYMWIATSSSLSRYDGY